MLFVAWLQMALLPGQASTSLLHARGVPAAARLGLVRMAEGNPIHRASVDELSLAKEPVSELGAWYKLSGTAYAEESRKYRRTVYMHDEWVKHRSSERFIKNLRTIGNSGVSSALGMELGFITATAVFCVAANLLLHGYQDFSGVMHPSPLAGVPVLSTIKQLSLPAFTFSIGMPALSLLLVFRTNTAYSRWNEARTLWGGVINSCRNVVRQANIYFQEDAASEELKDVLAVNTAGFAKALRNFLRGPTDDEVLRRELMDIVKMGKMSEAQVNACMKAKNRPMFMLNAMSAALRKAKLDPIDRARIDASITTLVDLTGACERIFKSPVPLVYTRHTSRFLALFLIFLPFGIWPTMGDSWNHWATVPAADIVAFFLLGIEEIGIQIEEPFSILPIEAFCNGAIAATIDELLQSTRDPSFEVGAPPGALPAAKPSHAAVPAATMAPAAAPVMSHSVVAAPPAVTRAAKTEHVPLGAAKWEPGSFEKLWAASK